MSGPRILVTGAAGTIGRVLVTRLVAEGYQVRALTTRPVPPEADGVEWRQMDWRSSLDFDPQVEGCAAVAHLAVERQQVEAMPRLNVEATGLLLEAAERAGARLFCYFSSISVYGSPRSRWIEEDAPVLTPDRDVAEEYWADRALRGYGRSKVAAERLLAAGEPGSRRVILRPTVVRNRASVLEMGDWSRLKRMVLAGRLSHTVAVEDVVEVVAWLLRETLGPGQAAPGVETYNVGDDETAGTFADFYRQAYAWTKEERYRCPPHLPAEADRLFNWWKYRTLAARWPLSLVHFSSEKLFRAGYRHGLGAAGCYRQALLG